MLGLLAWPRKSIWKNAQNRVGELATAWEYYGRITHAVAMVEKTRIRVEYVNKKMLLLEK